jgi:ribose 5-phosphate isomerase B
MKIYIAADHAGYELKEALVPFITSLGHEVEDCGAASLNEGDDYPDMVRPCAEKVVETPGSFGVVIGASGQGEAMAANRVPGARAAVYYGEAARPQTDVDGDTLGIIESARAHNDANILSLGARFLTEEEAKDAVSLFLSTPFSGEERHIRRIEKLG